MRDHDARQPLKKVLMRTVGAGDAARPLCSPRVGKPVEKGRGEPGH